MQWTFDRKDPSEDETVEIFHQKNQSICSNQVNISDSKQVFTSKEADDGDSYHNDDGDDDKAEARVIFLSRDLLPDKRCQDRQDLSGGL